MSLIKFISALIMIHNFEMWCLMAECGGYISKPLEEINSNCATVMSRRSYISENYGDDFKHLFEPYEVGYYRNYLDNSELITNTMMYFSDPNNSPISKSFDNMKTILDLKLIDINKTNKYNGIDWIHKMGIQLKDNTLFYLDNTTVSRNNVFYNHRTF